MKKFTHTITWLGGFILLSLFSSIAGAQSYTCPGVLRVQGPSSVDIDPQVPNGTILWTGEVQSGDSGYNCPNVPRSGDGNYYETTQGVGPKIGGYYASGVAGIGVRMRFSSTIFCGDGGWWPVTCSRGPNFPSNSMMTSHGVTVELVKTGRIPDSGGIMAGEFAYLSITGVKIISYQWTPPVIVRPRPPSCKVTTPSLGVTLGSVPRATFTGLNSVSASTPFEIQLSCSGSAFGGSAAVRVTMTDNSNRANRSTSLSLSKTSTAKGVAIQVLRQDGTLVAYGPDSNANNNENQWSAGTTGDGTFRIPLTARYVQTGPITGGSANGQLTFTMNYQ